MTRGIIYVASDDNYFQEAIRSAKSAKSVMPSVDIGFITDSEETHPIIDKKIICDLNYSFRDKVQFLSSSPFDESIFVDTDTYFSEPVYELFDILDRYSIAAAHAPQRMTERTNAPDALPELNTGVIAYKLPECEGFFSSWMNKYQSLSFETDQPSFRMAFYQTELQTLVLPPEYNCRSIFPGYLFDESKIIHGRHRIEMEKVEKKLNQSKGMRLHYPVGQDVKVKHYKQYTFLENFSSIKLKYRRYLRRSYEVLQKEGLPTLTKKIYKFLIK
jgi:hypothetical protein